MSRDWRLYQDDILEACEKILRYVAGMTREAFLADTKTFDAVVRNLEIIGEASAHLPDSVRVKTPDIPWKRMQGLRNILAHAYFGVDEDIVWDLASRKVSELLSRLREISGADV